MNNQLSEHATKQPLKAKLGGVVGNLLQHYDYALFGLLAPFLAPLFFPTYDPLSALIFMYGMLPLGACVQPLGACIMGWIGDVYGRRRALFFSLVGMACSTAAVACLPTYHSIGIAAPLLLACSRVLQHFFASGEAVGGAILVLENTAPAKKTLLSSLFDASSIAGVLLASFAVALCSHIERIEQAWRPLFALGALTACCGVWLRNQEPAAPARALDAPGARASTLKVLWAWRSTLLAVIAVSGFSFMTYNVAFTLMNGLAPLITTVSNAEMVRVNTILLGLDLLLLPCCGWLASKIGKERLMCGCALLCAIISFPLFSALAHASVVTVIVVRSVIVLLGVGFSASYHAWAQELVPLQYRYTVLSVGYSLGSQLIGAPSAALSLWLFQVSGSTSAPAAYLFCTACAAAWTVYRYSQSFGKVK